MKKIILLSLLCLSGCAALGQWNGRREYIKSQVKGKTVWGGYGYGYMQAWKLSEAEDNIEKIFENLRKKIETLGSKQRESSENLRNKIEWLEEKYK